MQSSPYAVPIELARAAVALAKQALDRPAGGAQGYRSLANLCRQTGALQEARELYIRAAQSGDDAKAQALADLLGGLAAPRAPGAAVDWPSPFLRLSNVLPPDDHARALTTALSVLDTLQPAGVDRPETVRRQALVVHDASAFAPLIVDRVRKLARERAAPLFGLPVAAMGERVELQFTVHPDGGFFEPHTDRTDELHPARWISFVYYFHRQPCGFQGGELSLFDNCPARRRYATTQFTLVPPTDNSLVLFPSDVPHEVRPVTVPSGDLADARFTLNGWIHAARPH